MCDINPLFQIEQDYKKINSLFPNLIIKKYVVLKDDCLINKSINGVNIVHFSNFYYKIYICKFIVKNFCR